MANALARRLSHRPNSSTRSSSQRRHSSPLWLISWCPTAFRGLSGILMDTGCFLLPSRSARMDNGQPFGGIPAFSRALPIEGPKSRNFYSVRMSHGAGLSLSCLVLCRRPAYLIDILSKRLNGNSKLSNFNALEKMEM
jgi:hypothetical protein